MRPGWLLLGLRLLRPGRAGTQSASGAGGAAMFALCNGLPQATLPRPCIERGALPSFGTSPALRALPSAGRAP